MFENIKIIGLFTAIIIGLAALSACESSISKSNVPQWQEVVNESFEQDISLSSRHSYYAALEGDAQGYFGLCQDTVNDKSPDAWKQYAEEWCVAAAKKSYPGSSQFLAEHYAEGTFGEEKTSLADKWFEAAVQDQEHAQELTQHIKDIEDIWGGFWIRETEKKPVRRENESFNSALAEITELAENGDTTAMVFLAGRYYNGYGVEQSDELYFKWISRAADMENARAAWGLGAWYRFSDGGRRDRKKALYGYEKAIEFGLGSYDSMHTNPVRFVQQLRAEEIRKTSNNLADDEIISRLKEVGVKGNVEDDTLMCSVALDLHYMLGNEDKYCTNLPKHVPISSLKYSRNYAIRNIKGFAKRSFYSDQLAHKWVQDVLKRVVISAKAGNPDYADALAFECAADLTCIETWQNLAISGYEKRAAQGDRKAMYALAAIYSGRYQAHQVGNVFVKIPPPLKDQSQSDQWLHRAIKQYRTEASSGDADAQFSMGYFYEQGIGVGRDKRLAREWYRKFLSKSSPERLAYFHISGGHSNIFNDLRKACLKDNKEINMFSIMTGNLHYSELENLDCSKAAAEQK